MLSATWICGAFCVHGRTLPPKPTAVAQADSERVIVLLLMNILRSRSRCRYRGMIHFYPADADSAPEIEFVGGEGPEEVMNQVQDFAVPEIRKSIETLGPFLRWEELDLEAGVVRRHRTRFHDCFEFELCPDERGIELVLPTDDQPDADGERNRRARPWVPLRRLVEPGEEQRAVIGWSVEEPKLRWRYIRTRYAPPTIEMTWSCASLPSHWAAQVLAWSPRKGTGGRFLDCHFAGDDSSRCPERSLEGGQMSCCRMDPTRDGLLVYRGYFPLPAGSARPACLRMLLTQPLVVAGPETASSGDECNKRKRELDEVVPATIDALDFRALIDGRPTRLVAGADLKRRFEAEVLTGEDVLLPEVIPAGAIPGLPWELAAESAGAEKHDEEQQDATAEAASRHRWRLAARLRSGGDEQRSTEEGCWGEIAWQGEPPSLVFGLGSFDASRAPRITHIENRRASVAWKIEAGDEGGSLCLSVPHWVPVGCSGRVALPPREDGFDYAAEVRARLDGLEERFLIDQRSEVSCNRLFLGPRRWRFRDQDSGVITDGEALGEGAGCVRWRRSRVAGGGEDPELGPTDWAAGSAPVLLLRKGSANALHWGGLFAPRAVPWDALEEVPAESTPDPEEILMVPRSTLPFSSDRTTAIWIDLWGFVCRYHVRSVVFTRSQGETSEPTAWIADTGLELFPRRSGYLLRSFSPIYAVRDPEPRIFSLRPTTRRPTLHIGRELDAGSDSPVLEIGAETYVRYQLAEAGRVPETFEPGRVPGARLRLAGIGRRVVWLAVEQRRGDQGRQAGYLLSWDAARGWRFRGFFAHRGATVELGPVRRGDRACRVLLGGEGTSRVSTFRLTIDRQGGHLSEGAPEAACRQLTPEMIRAWETDHFAPERRPLPLKSYGVRILQQATGDRPWIFELVDGDSKPGADLPAGIRVWELHGETGEDLTDARVLGDDTETEEAAEPAEPEPAEPAEPEPATPAKRILRADDDDGF